MFYYGYISKLFNNYKNLIMFKKVLVSVFIIYSLFSTQAQENRWGNYDNIKGVSLPYDIPEQFIAYKLDEASLLNDLKPVKNWMNNPVKNSSVVILIPNVNGKIERYKMAEASVMVESLQAKYPNIRSFIGQGIDNPSAVLRMSYSPQEGFAGMVRSISNKTLFFSKGSNGNYAFYNRIENKELLNCTTEEFDSISINQDNLTNRDANTGQLSTFRLALTCNGEYGAWAGGTIAAVLAEFNTTMTRVNGVYEQELAIHLNMIDNTNLIYLDGNTDPYTGLDNQEIHNNITSVAGSLNFDIGHLVGQGGDGGNAGCIGCVCNDNNKAGGYTSTANPQGDFFDIDYVAHEMGHQFGGNHTWTSVYDPSVSASVPFNEGVGASLEPGSGSTIMAYAGITGTNANGISTDVQQHSDDYFHFYSIQQITNYIASTSCQTTTTLNQTTPTVNAGSNYVIPQNTPFILEGSGTSDGTTTYCWEENDLGGYSEQTTLPTPTSTSGPSFRSLKPTISPKRFLPDFTTVANGSIYNGAIGSKWELLNTVSRQYKFKLTVRDNIAGGAQNVISSDVIISVNDAIGPFEVTSQPVSETWATGQNKAITWNVAGTDAATSNVKISLVDTDGSELAVLVASTPNDGTENITVPNITSGTARIMVSAVGNIYYSINAANLGINTESLCTGLCESSGNTSFATSTTLVEFNTINNSSDKPSGYSDYTSSQQTTVVRGQSYDLSVNVNTDGSYKIVTKVWIDWNRDCVFNTTDEEYDLGEAINVTNGATSNSPLSIAIPTGASLGSTTMRVSSAYTGDPVVYATSCQTEFDGEVEDYTVIITDPASIDDYSSFISFNINPNPNNGNFKINLKSDNSNDIFVKVYDMIGRQIYKNSFNNNSTIFQKQINLNSVNTGIYLVNVSDGVHSNTEQIIIK